MSRVPLTAVITLMPSFAESRAPSFFLIDLRLLDVVLHAFVKSSLFFSRHCASWFSWNAHHQCCRRDYHLLRHQRSGGDHRAFTDARAVQNGRADTDQRVVLNDAAVQRYRVPHRDAIPYDQRKTVVQMQHAVVLNAGFLADHDGTDVAAHARVGPDAGPFADSDIANHLRG